MIQRYLCLPVLLTAVFCMGAPVRAQQGSPPQHAQNQRALSTPDSASRSVVAGGTPSVQEVEVRRVRISKTDRCQVIMELGGRVHYQAVRLSDPDRIYFDIEHARLSNELLDQPIDVPSGSCLKAVRVAQNRADVVRVVLDVAQVKDYSVSELADPDRLVVDEAGAAANTAANAAPETGAKTTALAPGSSAPEVRGEASAPKTAPSETAPSPATAEASAPKTAPSETAPSPATGEASTPKTAPSETAPSPAPGEAPAPTTAPPETPPSAPPEEAPAPTTAPPARPPTDVPGEASAPKTAPSETAPSPATGEASAPKTAPSETA